MRTPIGTKGRGPRPAPPLIAVGIALLALALAAAPVAAAEHYRSAAALRDTDGGPKLGSAYLDRYFGGSPPGPTKTTIRVVVPNVAAGTYAVRIVAGACFSEGTVIVKLAARTASAAGTTKLDRTLTLTSTQRRKVQQAYDAGAPVAVIVARGDFFVCGQFGTPRFIP